MNQNVFILAVACAVVGGVVGIQFKDCGSKKGKVISLDIPGCPGTGECDLIKGTNATISISFSTAEAVTKVKAVVHGILAHVPIPFPLDNPDGCKYSGLACPLTSGGTFKYSTKIFVRTEYPSVRLVIKWELQDQSGDDIVCLEMPAAIKSKSKSQNAIPRIMTL